jgi:hypothetical protein
LSAKEEYFNEQVTYVLAEGEKKIPDSQEHLFMDILADRQQIVPYSRNRLRHGFQYSLTQRTIDE